MLVMNFLNYLMLLLIRPKSTLQEEEKAPKILEVIKMMVQINDLQVFLCQ